MKECFDSSAAEAGARACIVCGHAGAPVHLQTVKALLTDVALRRVQLTHYRFCANPACPVVYFGNGGDQFDTQHLRVPVWHKEPAGARHLCYCFGETEAEIRAELREHGRSGVVDRIHAHVKARRCACEIRNPRGACCLGDVIAAVKRLSAEVFAGED